MSEFVPIEMRIQMTPRGWPGDYVELHRAPGRFTSVATRPGDAQLIVDWMAKRTAENVAWLEARDEVLLVMSEFAYGLGICKCDFARDGTPIYVCWGCKIKAVLAVAVPEDKPCDRRIVRCEFTQDESEVDGG